MMNKDLRRAKFIVPITVLKHVGSPLLWHLSIILVIEFLSIGLNPSMCHIVAGRLFMIDWDVRSE